MVGLKKINELLVKGFTLAGGLTLVLMMLIACANMAMRLIGNPISAAYELVGYLGALTVALPLGYTQVKKSHIAVDIVTSRFPAYLRKIASCLGLLMGIFFFLVVAWQVGVYAQTLRQVGEVSETLRIPYYPFAFGVALSCALMTLCMIFDLLVLIFSAEKQPE